MAAEVSSNKYQITQKYVFRNDPNETYTGTSNFEKARGHSKRMVAKTFKQNALVEQVEKSVSKGIIKELTQEEIDQLRVKPHQFSYYNLVENPNSTSTPW